MDRIKKARGPLRSAVTKVVNDIEAEMVKTPLALLELQVLLRRLESSASSLSEMDEKLLCQMLDDSCTEEDYESESTAIEEYRNKVIRARVRIELAMVPAPSTHSPPGSMASGYDSVTGSISSKKIYKLPKIQIKKFSGELTEWLSFWSQFQKIHEDQELHDSDKFQYLYQAMVDGSRARELVDSYPQTAANYPKVISALQDRFGNQMLLKQVYVRELHKMALQSTSAKGQINLSDMFVKLESHLRSLESLGVTLEMMTTFLYPMVESSLPEDTLIAWQRSQNYGQDGSEHNPPKSMLDYLMEFLKQEVVAEEQRKLVRGDTGVVKKEKQTNCSRDMKKSAHDDTPTAASLYSGQAEGSSCLFCDKPNHTAQECFKGAKMGMDEKKRRILEGKCCFVCLRKGHPAKACKSPVICTFCNKKHYAIMCPEAEKYRTENKDKDVEDITTGLQSMAASLVNNKASSVVFMKTLLVRLVGKHKKMVVRLVFDDGNQRSYIRSSTAKQLQCPVIDKFSLQNVLFGGRLSEIKTKQSYQVTIEAIDGKARRQLVLLNEDVICGNCPVLPKGPWIEELAAMNIYLTETSSEQPDIEILIGSDLWGTLMTGKMCKLQCGLTAVESVFGWTLSGPLPTPTDLSCAALSISMMSQDEKTLPELWKLETIGIRDTAERITQEAQELQVRKKFKQNISRTQDGRYVVNLPWISPDMALPNNRVVAEKRLVTATKKLVDVQMYQTYNKIFEDWEKEGIIEEVEMKSTSPDHFLPHRPVFKPQSLTTPVRPVFDASCRIGKNPSLNQCLEKGPNLLELIPSILHRFRQKKIGAVSDIRKAFQMVGVAEQDRQFQKFLWWEGEDQKKLKIYRHCRVVFGMNCSPFILAAVLEHHLDQVSQEQKTTSELLKKSLYVDNCVISFDTEDEYLEFKEKSVALLGQAKMELRQWESSLKTKLEPNSITGVLGLTWNKEEDTLQCRLPDRLETVGKISKRTVLSTVSSIFDPIGFACPALLQPKILLQDSWAVNMDWDEEWKAEALQKYKSWYADLPQLLNVKIPRCAFGYGVSGTVQIHTFSDASNKAYAAVVFARVQVGSQIMVQLLSAKSRVAPLDKKKVQRVTIPRLELLGGLIGARLTQTVKEALNLQNVINYFWTDSSTALGWIRRDEDWGTFVGNRVREISKLTELSQWRFVPGNQNPADFPSRGCTPTELVESRWWEGPTWLKECEELWPENQFRYDEDAIAAERKKTTTMAALEIIQPRFSSYLKNICTAAWVRRFIINCRTKGGDKISGKYPNLKEMKTGEKDVWFQVQRLHYQDKPELRNMNVELGTDGLWHVKTRLLYKEDSELFRSPILLPKDDPLVHQLIDYIHRSNCHAGIQFVLGKLRERYWIPCGRRTVGQVIRSCVTCRRHSSKSMICDPAPLPVLRMETKFAFQTTGVDLAGPFTLKGGKKAWTVLYTCAVYRGVHFDIVDTLSADEFLDSLQKFTWTIGRPSTIYSDNGTNFVGAHNLMKKLDWSKLEEKLHVKQIHWIFNPPSAPWWGGWWERLVRTTKDLLKRMIATARLTRKELDSCLASISHTINDRPLTTLTEDSEDLIPLTPAMFMRDLPIAGLPERENIGSTDLQKSYRKLRDLKKALSERFRKEYLAQLIQYKNEKACPDPAVGDIVLVGADNKKRYQWPMGRILELYPGKDKKVRVARVRTATGVFLRPLQRLYPLEVPSPKSIYIPPEMESLVQTPTQPQQEEVIIKTRSGRVVHKPSYYSLWNY